MVPSMPSGASRFRFLVHPTFCVLNPLCVIPMCLWVFSRYILDVCADDLIQSSLIWFNLICFVSFSFNLIVFNLLQFNPLSCNCVFAAFCLSALNSAFRLWGSCVVRLSLPLRGSGIFFPLRGLGFPEGPLFGVSQGVVWPCPHGFLSRVLASLLVFPIFWNIFAIFGASSLGSPPIGGHSSEAWVPHLSDQPINVRRW